METRSQGSGGAPVGLPLLAQLRELLSLSGTSADSAISLLQQPESVGREVHDLLLACLVHEDGPDAALIPLRVASTMSRAAVLTTRRGSAPSMPFTEMEALTILVRLLAVGTGDLIGDTITPDPLDPCRVEELEGSFAARVAMSPVARSLRSQALVLAVINLIERHRDAFDRCQETYLRVEALRALRLLLTPEGLLRVGGEHTQSAWWVEEDLGYLRCGGTRRRLVEVLLDSLQSCGDIMGQKAKLATLGSLWSLTAASSYIRTRMQQSGGEQLIAEVFRSQVRAPPPFVEAPLVVECGLLASIAAGGRSHERQLVKLGMDMEVLEMFRRWGNHRQVVGAGLVLLGVLANDESVNDRLLSTPELLAVVKGVRDRWPQEAAQAVRGVIHHLSPLIRDLAAGKSAETYVRLRSLRTEEALPDATGRHRPQQQRSPLQQRRAASLRRCGGNMPRALAVAA
mmetsp:Transcript_161010/g.296612  ORF Transcript_161010/g.296612 Transcript_161010/m.296612 type:complete len:457 (-) Transcript_161010:16-1386(-)